ncbi:MAG: hypothetical protein HWN81_22775 [Candidatus Lokiarchaeota archaeon]|nr:hypothetical protein [Candidatus Lokiarchaeota archaeon]
MSDKWHGGKGDKSRISNVNKFSRNMEKIYERKNWRMWAVWEGYDTDSVYFDESDIDEFQPLSYSEYKKRFISGKKI